MADFWDMTEFRTLAADLTAAGAKAEPLASAVVAKATLDVVTEAKYDAPVDTGFLVNSISADINGLEGVAGPTAHYGVFVELGTSRMAPQPYLFPALDRITPNFEAAMAQVIDQSLGGA